MNQSDKLARCERYRERLLRDGFLLEVPHGKSMWPMLRNRKDRFYAEAPKKKPERFDLPVYYRPSDGHIIVHRIIAVKDNMYVMRGDNCYENEYGISEQDIIAVVTGFYRGKKLHHVTEAGYRQYVRIWTAIYPLRWIWHVSFYRLYQIAGKIAAKCRQIGTNANESR